MSHSFATITAMVVLDCLLLYLSVEAYFWITCITPLSPSLAGFHQRDAC